MSDCTTCAGIRAEHANAALHPVTVANVEIVERTSSAAPPELSVSRCRCTECGALWDVTEWDDPRMCSTSEWTWSEVRAGLRR